MIFVDNKMGQALCFTWQSMESYVESFYIRNSEGLDPEAGIPYSDPSPWFLTFGIYTNQHEQNLGVANGN